LISLWGQTPNIREEAPKNIQEAIEGIIEVRKAQQLPIPSPDIVEISVAA
jgi:predicted RNase H-like HicB family nuclease